MSKEFFYPAVFFLRFRASGQKFGNMKLMKGKNRPSAGNGSFLLTGLIGLTGCGGDPGGLAQQRITELEGQVAIERQRADRLQVKLETAGRPGTPASPAPAATATTPAAGEEALSRAERAAAAELFADQLRDSTKPGRLTVFPEAVWVGFKLETGNEGQSATVPFYKKPGQSWTSGWTAEQVVRALKSPQAVPLLPVSADPATQPAAVAAGMATIPKSEPAYFPAAQSPRPGPVPLPGIKPPVDPLVPSLPSVVKPKPAEPSSSGAEKRFRVDPATGKTQQQRADGTWVEMPTLR